MKEILIIIVLIAGGLTATNQIKEMLMTDAEGNSMSRYGKLKVKELPREYVERLEISAQLNWNHDPDLVRQYEALEKLEYESCDIDSDIGVAIIGN